MRVYLHQAPCQKQNRTVTQAGFVLSSWHLGRGLLETFLALLFWDVLGGNERCNFMTLNGNGCLLIASGKPREFLGPCVVCISWVGRYFHGSDNTKTAPGCMRGQMH